MDFSTFNMGGGATNQWGMPMQIQNGFDNADSGNLQKYLQMANAIQSQFAQQAQSIPPIPMPQAPSIQTNGGENGVGYRQPGFMRKGLLG